MVGCDENSTQCLRSCSCSYTSIVYSEILTDNEAPPSCKSEQKSFRRSTVSSPKCTCPHPPRCSPHPPVPIAPITLPPFPAFSDVRDGPLQLRTCLPLPLPATPMDIRRSASHISLRREPDYLSLERTLVSTYGGKPFVPQEPQKLYYVRSSQKYVGVVYNAQYDHCLFMRRNQKHMAEWIVPRDPNLTVFQSVVYAKGKKKGEYISLLGEPSLPLVSVPPSLKVVAQADNSEVSVSPTPVPSTPRLHADNMASRDFPPGSCLLRSASNECSSLYRAMGSTATSSASSLAQSEASSVCRSESAGGRITRLWKELYEDRFNGVTESKQSTKDTRRSESQSKATTTTSWETSLSENNIFRSGTFKSLSAPTSQVSSIAEDPMAAEAKEWEREIARLDRFLATRRSISQLSCSTAASFRRCKRRAPSSSARTSTTASEETAVAKLGSGMRQMVVTGVTAVAAWAKSAFSKKKN